MSKWIIVLALFCAGKTGMAINGDTTHVITHNQELVVTNPGSGWNEYRNWGVFPDASVDYRKVYVVMSYKCPSGQNCGEWDYIDQVWLRRQGSADSTSMDLEMVRFITPYGNSFSQSWNFQWKMDITDFAAFLHDSVEIGYVHTGYETNVGRGWLVTLDFVVIEGTPVADFQEMNPFYNGNWTYGNAADDIENHLGSVNATMSNNTNTVRVRANHTGHGADATGCSEFCDKYRDLYMDGTFVERIQRWRKCGDNALYPQAGTWVYDRGNWCPGAVVYPYIRDFSVSPGSTHAFDLNMQPYTAASPSGNEYVVAYLFQYASPNATVDASIEDILEPNDFKEFSRHNPVCANPRIIIRNNGSSTLTSAVFNYGFNGQPQLQYTWNGSLPYGASDTIVLPGTMVPQSGQTNFSVTLTSPNGQSDEYPLDNTNKANAAITPVYTATSIIIEFQSNNEPQDNGYRLEDANGNILFERSMGSLSANTLYRDTIPVNSGCFKFVVDDMDESGGDGLAFWANSNDGTGYARLRNQSNSILRSFSADFGSLIEWNFTIGNVFTGVQETMSDAEVLVFPNPTNGQVTIDLSGLDYKTTTIEVIDITGKVIHTESFGNNTEARVTVDLSQHAPGIYFVRVQNGTNCWQKKVSLVK